MMVLSWSSLSLSLVGLLLLGVNVAEAQRLSILQIAQSDSRFSMLVSALEIAGLDIVFECETANCRPFTVFAPTNEAFAELPDTILDPLLNNPDFRTHLSNTLLYHVVVGEIPSDDITNNTSVETLLVDENLITTIGNNDTIFVNDAQLIQPNIMANNGIIHAIDKVLLPFFMRNNLLQVAAADGNFGSFLAAVQTANLTGALGQGGPYTLFAPNDLAFGRLDPMELLELLDSPTLVDILTYHVIPNAILLSNELLEGAEITTLEGANVTVSYNGYWFFRFPVLNHDVEIVGYNLLASNGVLHVINEVLLPPFLEEPNPSLATLLEQEGRLSVLVSLLEQVGFMTALRNNTASPLTLFAPTNAALNRLGADTLDALRNDTQALMDVLSYHAVPGDILYEDFVDGSRLTTVNDLSITVEVVPFRRAVLLNGGSVRVNSFDLLASNGVLYVIQTLLEPLDNILDIVTERGMFGTLLSAAAAANLTSVFSTPGPITLFAPTDQAFEDLGMSAIDVLLQDIPMLAQLLLYHVVPGDVVLSSDDNIPSSLTTIQGEDIAVTTIGAATVLLNDDTEVVTRDIPASNGYIQVINAVLIPPGLMGPTMDIVEIGIANNFVTLVDLVALANLTATLQSPGPFTLFAPTNAAFEALGPETIASLTSDTAVLTQILLYHVVSGTVLSSDLLVGSSIQTIQGESITVGLGTDGSLVLNGDVGLEGTDVLATNGVIHVVNAVLLPPSLQTVDTPSVAPSPAPVTMAPVTMAPVTMAPVAPPVTVTTAPVAINVTMTPDVPMNVTMAPVASPVNATNITNATMAPGPFTLAPVAAPMPMNATMAPVSVPVMVTMAPVALPMNVTMNVTFPMNTTMNVTFPMNTTMNVTLPDMFGNATMNATIAPVVEVTMAPVAAPVNLTNVTNTTAV